MGVVSRSNGLHTHRGQGGRSFSNQRGASKSCYPYPLSGVGVLENPWIDSRGRQRKLMKASRRRLSVSYSSPRLGVWRLLEPLP